MGSTRCSPNRYRSVRVSFIVALLLAQTGALRLAAVQITVDVAAVNNRKASDTVKVQSTGSAVLRAQISLDRVHFSCGEIDGVYGDNLRRAVKSFQKLHGLSPTGVVGPATWEILNRDNEPRLVRYTIAYQDVAGPFENVPKDMLTKAKLDYLGYSSPVEALSEKFHCSPQLIAKLNPVNTKWKPGQQIIVPNVIVPTPARASSIVVSKSDSSLSALDPSANVLAYYPVSTGSTHDPLPIGKWKVVGVSWYPKYHYNPALFWDANPSHARAVIAAGPNNPVGVVWIEISKEHYGIHGTPEPSRIGYANSHGCIDLTNWDAAELAQIVAPGTLVVLTK